MGQGAACAYSCPVALRFNPVPTFVSGPTCPRRRLSTILVGHLFVKEFVTQPPVFSLRPLPGIFFLPYVKKDPHPRRGSFFVPGGDPFPGAPRGDLRGRLPYARSLRARERGFRRAQSSRARPASVRGMPTRSESIPSHGPAPWLKGADGFPPQTLDLEPWRLPRRVFDLGPKEAIPIHPQNRDPSKISFCGFRG